MITDARRKRAVADRALERKIEGEKVLDQLKQLCKLFCTQRECAAVIGCSVDRLEKLVKDSGWENWRAFSDEFSAYGRVSLRRSQFKKAESGDTAMLKHMGEHYLDQGQRVTVGFDPNKPVVFTLDMGRDLTEKQEGDEA